MPASRQMSCCARLSRSAASKARSLRGMHRSVHAGFRRAHRTTVSGIAQATRPRARDYRMRRRTLLGALPAALALAHPAIAQGPAARTLRFVPQANLTSPDPIWTTANVTRNHALMIWDTLYGLDAALQPQPQMCSGHEVSADQLTWQFTLRDGLMFHDG